MPRSRVASLIMRLIRGRVRLSPCRLVRSSQLASVNRVAQPFPPVVDCVGGVRPDVATHRSQAQTLGSVSRCPAWTVTAGAGSVYPLAIKAPLADSRSLYWSLLVDRRLPRPQTSRPLRAARTCVPLFSRMWEPSQQAVALPADNALVDTLWERGVATAAALRALPAPSSPPPGPIDGVVGMLLARAAPFDQATQLALRRQHGWGTAAPQPITEIRSHGRWMATPALARLTGTSAPRSLLDALRLLEELVPCPSAVAAAALITAGLANSPMHAGGVLTLARWYGVRTNLRLEAGRGGATMVVGPPATSTRAATHRILTAVGRAGWVDLGRLRGDDAPPYGRPIDYAISQDSRLRRTGDVVVRVDDRGSGLSALVVRMLVTAPSHSHSASCTRGWSVAGDSVVACCCQQRHSPPGSTRSHG
jgi:hypothetical protein